MSIINSNNKNKFDILFIDNGSTDKTSEYLKDLHNTYNSISIIHYNNNKGFVKAINSGIDVAKLKKYKFAVILNNDIEVSEKWLDELINVANQNELNIIVGGKIINANKNGKIQNTGTIIKNGIKNPYIDLDINNPITNNIEDRLWVTGCCMLIKMSIFNKEISLKFNEEFSPGYFEEADFCTYLHSYGYKIKYAPKCVIYHYMNKTSVQIPNIMKIFNEHWKLYLSKWSHYINKINNDNKCIKLNLNCGNNIFENYINIDTQLKNSSIFVDNDLTELKNIDTKAKIIFSQDILQNNCFEKINFALKRWYNILDDDGILLISFTDFNTYYNLWNTISESEKYESNILSILTSSNPIQYIFTESKIIDVLHKNNFKNVIVKYLILNDKINMFVIANKIDSNKNIVEQINNDVYLYMFNILSDLFPLFQNKFCYNSNLFRHYKFNLEYIKVSHDELTQTLLIPFIYQYICNFNKSSKILIYNDNMLILSSLLLKFGFDVETVCTINNIEIENYYKKHNIPINIVLIENLKYKYDFIIYFDTDDDRQDIISKLIQKTDKILYINFNDKNVISKNKYEIFNKNKYRATESFNLIKLFEKQNNIEYKYNESITKKKRKIKNKLTKSNCNNFVTLIIPVLNNLPMLQKCLTSILQYTNISYEIIIIDNSCDLAIKQYLNDIKMMHEIYIIENDKNNGFPKSINQAIKIAKGNYICILNSDIEIIDQTNVNWLPLNKDSEEDNPSNWLQTMINEFKKNERIGIVGPGAWQDKELNETWLLFWCVLIKKSIIDKIGLLDDELFFSAFEDLDYCKRIINAGYLLKWKSIPIIHYGGVSDCIVDRELYNNIGKQNIIKKYNLNKV
ncbi:MAG: glycosyltransferase, partial [Acidithiobacillus sp.]